MTHNYGRDVGNLHVIDYYLHLTLQHKPGWLDIIPRKLSYNFANLSYRDLDLEEEHRDGWA